MHKGKIVFSGVLGALMLAALYSGGVGGCGGGGGTTPAGTTRNMTGTIAANSLAGLHLKGKRQTLACTDLQVCCAGYDGSLAVTEVEADCTFTLALPLNNFCYCDVFTGSDDDGNGCKETFVASLGCSEDGYSGAIPIFPDDDDSVDDISIGTGTVEGRKVVSTEDPCAQVDEDDDGTSNEGDTDDDGDGSLDSEDDFNEFGCENADEFDSDDDDTPDIFEALWGSQIAALKVKGQADSFFEEFFLDSDDDDIPDGCDDDFECESNEEDTDGDCIPDEDDWCSDDGDGDGVGWCWDCDDDDAASTVECFEDDYCDIDSDGDGFNLCDDCDDDDSDVTYECFGDDFCSVDGDADGFDYCLDCDDENATSTNECYSDDICNEDNDNDDVGLCADCDDFDPDVTTGCYEDEICNLDEDGDTVGFCDDCDDSDATETNTWQQGCDVEAGGCESSECENDFECQLFAEDNPDDEFETDNVACVDGCCELTD